MKSLELKLSHFRSLVLLNRKAFSMFRHNSFLPVSSKRFMAPKGPPYYSIYTVLCKSNENEICRNPRISLNKLQTFVSDEKATTFRWHLLFASKVMNRNEISRQETKFRACRTKFRFVDTKFRLGKAKFRLPKRNLVFQKFLAHHRIHLYSCNHHLIAKRDQY